MYISVFSFTFLYILCLKLFPVFRPISRFLQQVKVPHVTSEDCNNDYAHIGGITKGMICAGKKGKDSCQVKILNTEVDFSRWRFKKMLGLIRLSPLVYDICIKRDEKNKTKNHISLLGNNQIRGGEAK